MFDYFASDDLCLGIFVRVFDVVLRDDNFEGLKMLVWIQASKEIEHVLKFNNNESISIQLTSSKDHIKAPNCNSDSPEQSQWLRTFLSLVLVRSNVVNQFCPIVDCRFYCLFHLFLLLIQVVCNILLLDNFHLLLLVSSLSFLLFVFFFPFPLFLFFSFANLFLSNFLFLLSFSLLFHNFFHLFSFLFELLFSSPFIVFLFLNFGFILWDFILKGLKVKVLTYLVNVGVLS